jgi:hypothetical protein
MPEINIKQGIKAGLFLTDPMDELEEQRNTEARDNKIRRLFEDASKLDLWAIIWRQALMDCGQDPDKAVFLIQKRLNELKVI